MEHIEEWRPVKGREGHYEVSNHGRVKSLPGGHGRGAQGVMLRAAPNSEGYLGVVLAKGGKKQWRTVHRLVASAFLENPCAYPFLNHIDHNRKNNSVINLEWCTAKYNTQHAVRAGRMRHGAVHPKAVAVEVSKDGVVLGRYDTILEASKALGAVYSSLCAGGCCGYSVRRLTME